MTARQALPSPNCLLSPSPPPASCPHRLPLAVLLDVGVILKMLVLMLSHNGQVYDGSITPGIVRRELEAKPHRL